MVTMSNVWDRTTDVLGGRAGVLATIAVLALYLPAVARDSVVLFAAPGSRAFALLGGGLSILVTVAAIWGQLALIGIATDPATTRASATRQATARLPAALAVAIVAILVVVLLAVPPLAAVGLSGADLSAMRTGAMPRLGGGIAAFLAGYVVVVLVLALAVGVRFVLVNCVVVNERRGLGAFGRSWRLTRGLAWRLVGVFLLYIVVVGVAVSAAQFITGAVFGLLLDGTALTAFLAAAAAGVVTTIFSVIAAVFSAQLYGAVTRGEGKTVFA